MCGHLDQQWGPWFYSEHSTVRTGSVEGEVGRQLLIAAEGERETDYLQSPKQRLLLGYLDPLACFKHLNFIEEGLEPLHEKECESGKSRAREGRPEAGK